MMGPEKLSTIRVAMRKSFKMSDQELLEWFNRQLQDIKPKPTVNQTEGDALRLLRRRPRQRSQAPIAAPQSPAHSR